MVGWQLAVLIAVAALLAAWTFAAVMGFDAAPGSLRALVLTLVAGTLIGIAGKVLSNLVGAIAPGPAAKTRA